MENFCLGSLMSRSPRYGVFATVTLFLGALLVSSGASATSLSPGPPLHRIMDCYSDPSGVLQYVTALELTSSSTYVLAPYRKGNGLIGKLSRGGDRINGPTVTFLTGAYGRRYLGHWSLRHMQNGSVVASNLALLTSALRPTYISCYPH